MEYSKDEKGSPIKLAGIFCLLVVLVIVATYFGLIYYRPFHVLVETFSSFIAFSIMIMAVNTYELSKNIPFLFIGIAYGFAGGFNIIHIIASNGMGFFQGETTNLSMQFSIIHRFMIAISIVFCFRLFYRTYKWITPLTITLFYSIVSVLLLMSVFKWGIFPSCYIPGQGSTVFKITSEYVLCFIVAACIIILFRHKRHLESNVFVHLQLYLYMTIASGILLTFYTVQAELTNVLAHVLRVISFYCIYRSIVKVGLKTPYKLLFNEVNQKNNSLKIKDTELRTTISRLEMESELRKSVEKMFLKNEACYKLLIENSRDAIVIYSQDKIIFANEGAVALIGFDNPGKLVGRLVNEIFNLNPHGILLDVFEKRFDNEGIAPTYETEVTDIFGQVIHVEISSANVIYDNQPAVLNLIRNISTHKQIEKMKKDVEEDRKLLNETLEFNRLITEFFSNISHELRTPLNVILSALQVLLLEENKNIAEAENIEKRIRYIDTIKQNCYRLLRLINNLIDISRIDSGYITPRIQNHNIVSIVEDITLSIAEYVENKGIKLIFDTDIEEKIIACDPDKIERIMLNLISNAVKFTEKGDQITVDISDKGDNIQILVKDTGIGIPEEKFQMIFERFRQVDNSLSKNQEGSGIGLSLVKAFVEMHGGNITVKSALGEGSEFIIDLPARTVDLPETTDHNIIYQDNSERVSIEFSDIYK